MSVASDIIAQALTNLSNDHRRASLDYLNLTARPGNDGTPRRLMSDLGFLQERQFTYLAPHQRNFHYADSDGPREITKIVFIPYGIGSDYRRLTSRHEQARVIGAEGGVVQYPGNVALLMAGGLDGETASPAKTRQMVQSITGRTGPAVHFIVNRLGDISVGPSIDAEVSPIPSLEVGSIFVALESALAITREDHQARRFNAIVEMPFTATQLVTLGVLVNKLLVALGTGFRRVFTDAPPDPTGFTYQWVTPISGLGAANFRQTPPTGASFDYSSTTSANFFQIVDAQGSFDLATDVWRPFAAPTPLAGREEIRVALGEVDTAGEESVQMGNYVTAAAGERSNEMQTTARRQMFVMRQRQAQQDSENVATNAAAAATTVDDHNLPGDEVANPGPHTYDFTTGEWGAPDPVLPTSVF